MGLPRASSAFAYAENEKLDIAIVGAGGRGASNLNDVASENIVALCDVDEARTAEAAGRFPGAKRHVDFRKMLDEMQGQMGPGHPEAAGKAGTGWKRQSFL